MSFDYYFSEEHNMFRQGLREFLAREVNPFIDEWEEKQQIPKTIWKKFAEMGYMGLNYPESVGGEGVDFFYSVIFTEELARTFSGGFGAAAAVINYMSATYIFKHGSPYLIEKYLKPTIQGELVSCIGITEPGAGSDVANIQTRAVREGDHYIVNGQKTFITNAVYGDYIVAVVKTSAEAGFNGISLLVIDRNTPGVSANKLKKLGWHASDTAELFFDNVKVPAENLIGEEGQGFIYLMGGLQLERLIGAVGAVAGSEVALERAMQYMNERKAFGRTINKFQVLRHNAAQIHADIETVKAYVYHCCKLHNEGKYAVRECSIAKLQATELSDDVAYKALQFFGGYGYMEEYKMARFFRDSRILTIGGGTTEIMREIIAKMLLDDKQYKNSGLSISYSKTGGEAASGAKQEPLSHHKKTEQEMAFDNVLSELQSRAANAGPLGKTLKFDFNGQHIFIDGNNGNNVSTEDKEADCTIGVAAEDLLSMIQGTLNPMGAFMQGKIKVKGDMGVAMKLNQLFGS